MHTVYLGLGTNRGDHRLNLETAIRFLEERVGTVVRTSQFHETEPWGFSSDNMFMNAAMCIDTQLSPRGLLEATQAIER